MTSTQAANKHTTAAPISKSQQAIERKTPTIIEEKTQRTQQLKERPSLNTAKLQAKKMNRPSKLKSQHTLKSASHQRDNKFERTRTMKILESFLEQGKLADGEVALTNELKHHPRDDQARFGLGVIQFLRAIESLSQDFYRFGINDSSARGFNVPFLRLPVPTNPNPEVVSYEKLRKTFATLVDNFMKAEATLAMISDANVKLPLRFGLIRMDLDGDGQPNEEETLWKVYSSITRNQGITLDQAQEFSIKFDRGDVHWLRGYCHLLTAFCQVYLAHDSSESFQRTAHLIFAKVDSPYPFLTRGKHVYRFGDRGGDISDLIALIHLINWPVVEPERMHSALHHLEDCVKQSREMWKYILAETDDDREWIPNPRQTGVIPNAKVTDEMITAWSGLMNEIEKILAGEKLIAFWRGDDGRGVNLRKFFLEPRTLDLVLWVQGTAAAPYLEKGDTTKISTWNSLQSAFGSQFPGFAIWFN
ncbi:MAG: hypothetical protein C0469_02060 [Cyanobacteria bacterium DS2.3.42]|nr:hypothetical protein [Cyanobacteria bacterium DS2.3.42]